MAEQIGTLLWQMRTARGWSLGQLAQRAGVHKSSLSRWEADAQQPRLPELEATLTALEATSAQRALALSCIQAPRALRHLNTSPTLPSPGPLPSAGDLLRAMRLRGRWTQEQVAQHLGVGQNTVARWERGERLPSTEQMQALCYALEADEKEMVALTTGGFAETSEEIEMEEATLHPYLATLLYNPGTEPVDLRFLMMERSLWQQATRDARAQPLLATVYAAHAHYLSLYKRWEEVERMAQRALALTPQTASPPGYTLRAVLKLAAAEVYGGNRLTPERGFSRIKGWLSHSQEAGYTAWILSDMGKYLALAGQAEEAVEMGRRAIDIAQEEKQMRQLDYSRLLVTVGHPEKALNQLPALPEQEDGIFVYAALIRCEAYLTLGKAGEAATWLKRAYAIIEAEGLKQDRFHADALAQRFEAGFARGMV